MPTYKLRGIDVDFPFEAYDCQLIYMEKVIQSLQAKCNALLESPTGTGKTLCLLCATLAWRKSLGGFSTGKPFVGRGGGGRDDDRDGDRDDGRRYGGGRESSDDEGLGNSLPTIVYTSRTHSQLRQVIQELKRSTYRPKMVILGSREQLCIHEEVSLLHGKAQNNACHYVRKKKEKNRCTHLSLVTDYLTKNPHVGDEPVDIEDLVKIGKTFGPCPYYVSRELHKVVDIVFAPYNYLIERGSRKSLKINWNNSILIFDEAHNLESLCADAASFDLSSGLLTACISEAKSCIDLSVARMKELNDKSQNPDNFAILRALLLKLEKRIAEVPIESRELGFTKPGPYIYELLADLNITHDSATKLIDTLEEASLLLEEGSQNKSKDNGCRLESFRDMLSLIFRGKDNSHANFYKVHVQQNETNATDVIKGKPSRTLSWWCFNPGIAMEEFSRMGAGSIILTSGTLSPLDTFAQELKLNFPIRLENPHVISSNQIWAGVVSVGPSGRSFNSSYRNRDSLEYKQELGNAIVNFARLVPDGLLVFFPSYYLLDQCIGCWKNMHQANSTSIWERICKHKKPVIEPRQSSLFPLAIEDYMTKLKDTSTSGAVFFAVCRGKVSEGLDFADHAGRAVVVTGMPFSMRTDPKIRLKREYLDQHAFSPTDGCKPLSGEDWYAQQASRAVNQAVGRVIRHRHDYGAIIFCDERFAYPSHLSQISLWIQPYMKCHSKFGDVIFTLSRFFRDVGKLRSMQSKDMESTNEVTTTQPVDRYLDSFVNSSEQTDQGSTVSSLSSLLEGKRGKISRQLKDVLPANRSSLAPVKDVKLNFSSSLITSDKKMLISGKSNVHCQIHEIVDLTSESTSVGCSAKKRKVFNPVSLTVGNENCTKHASSLEMSESNTICCLVKQEKPHISDDAIRLNCAEATSASQKEKSVVATQKNKGVQSAPVTCGNEEARGSAFLTQVKEKLSATEYKEFVEFMKALKSKAIKIGQVLQSIVRLFSGPERLPLLRRFKDFVPPKHQSLYENYLEANGIE